MTALIIGVATNKLYFNDLDPDDRAQPYLVDVAAELMTSAGATIDLLKRNIRLPKDTSMQGGAEKVNGVTTRTARRSGATQKWAVYGLVELLNEARFAISYSDMTRRVISSIIMRVAGNDADQWLANWERAGIEWIDLRTPATQICKLPYDPPNSLGGYRWPSRAEAANAILDPETLINIDCSTVGSAWHNMKTDRYLFVAMRQMGLIEAGDPVSEVAA